MTLPVMTKPDCLSVRHSKVNASDGTLIAPLQLSQPLVRRVEVSADWDRVDALW